MVWVIIVCLHRVYSMFDHNTMNCHLPSASGITYQIHIYFVSSINGYFVWWYTSSRFSIFGKHFLCTDDDFSWCLGLLADCEGRSWRDISTLLSIYLSTVISTYNTRFPGNN